MLIDKIQLDFWHKSQFVVRENTVLGKYTKYIFWQKNGFLWYFEGFSALLQFTLSWNCRFFCNLNLMFQLIFSLQGKILDFFLILWGFECTLPICPLDICQKQQPVQTANSIFQHQRQIRSAPIKSKIRSAPIKSKSVFVNKFKIRSAGNQKLFLAINL